jgi:hypothetical protein
MATNIKLKSSSLAGKTPTLSDLSLRELAVNTADGKLFLRKGDGSASDRIIDVTAPLQASEPMGHEDKSQSTISFNASTRVFTIQPASTSFNVWVKGIKYNFTTAQTVTIPNTTGLHYIFFNASGVLSSRTTFFDWENEAPTAYVYWNATAGTAPFVADERHGITLDWATHEYLHRTRGAVIANGFSLSNFTTTGTGSTDADSQFDLGNGTFFDEDLEVDIVHSNTPTADTWQQDLQGPARIPVFYLSGTGWVRDNPTDYALKQGTARIQYNLLNAGTWSAVDVPSNTHYTTSWIIATNNINYPVLAIMGQSSSNKISDQESISFSDLTLTNFPVVEFRPLWKIIWQTDSTYANTPKARIAGVYDIRQLSSVGIGGVAVSDHGLLTGLTDDDHLQYLHTTTTRTGVTAEFNTTGKITTTNSIGIGTTNPTNKLHVSGGNLFVNSLSGENVDVKLGVTQSNNNYSIIRNTRVSDSQSLLSFIINDGGEKETFTINTGGQVNIKGSGNWSVSPYIGVAGRLFFGDQSSATFAIIDSESESDVSSAMALTFKTRSGVFVRERLRITSTGNVGIGTTNPTGKLDVQGGDIYLTTASDPRIFIQNSGVGGAGFDIRKSDGTWAWRFTGEADGFKIRDHLNSLDKFYIEDTSTGNVWFNNIGNFGIGTTTPVSKVHAVVGSSSRFVIETTSTEVNSPLNMWNNNSSAIAGSGMVFSATTNLNQSIDAVFIGGVSSQRIGTDFLNSRTSFRVLSDGVFTDTSSSGAFYLEGSSTGTKIIANGIVGIGTANPQPTSKLEVQTPEYGGIRIDALTEYPALWLTQNGTDKWSLTSNFNNDNGFVIRESGVDDRVNILPGGNVGIGTTNPAAKLDVSGDLKTTGRITVDFGTALGGAYTGLEIKGDAAYSTNFSFGVAQNVSRNGRAGVFAGAYIDAEGNRPISFGTNGTERLSIEGNGNIVVHNSVGIGTTNPGSTLAVNGYITENSGDGTYYNVVTQRDIGFNPNQVPLNQYLGQLAFMDDYAPFALRRSGGGTNDLVVDSEGRIGIGLSNPLQELHIYKSVGNCDIRVQGGGVATYIDIFHGNDNYGIWGTSTTGRMSFATGSTEKLTILPNGDVGIGITNPSGRLDVFGGSLSVRNIGGTSSIEIGSGQTSNQFAHIDLIGDATYADFGLRIIRNNTGANTPTDIIHRGLGDFRLIAQDAGSVTLYTENTEKFRVASSGNVGIGTTNPTTKFDVIGNARIGGAAPRSVNGLTVGFTSNTAFATNTDVGDVNRTISLINESATTNAMSILGFRVNPGTPTTNAMLDMKFVQTGGTNTSALHYTFNHGGSTTFVDRFTILSSGNIGIGTTNPSARIHIENSNTTFTSPGDTNTPSIYLLNGNANSATAHSIVAVRTNGANSGDPFISFDIGGVIGWSAGIDNSDNDIFKISNNWADLGTSNRLAIATNGQTNFTVTYGGSPANLDAHSLLTFARTTPLDGVTYSGLDARLFSFTITPENEVAFRAANATIVSTNYINFRTNNGGVQAVRITTTGNVGIGNTNATAKLHINSVHNESVNYLKVGGTGSVSRFYRYIAVPAKATAGGVADTAKPLYVGRFYNGTAKLLIYAGGNNTEEGFEVTLHRDWGTASIPILNTVLGALPGEITFHHQTIDNDSYYLFVNYTYAAQVPINAINDIRFDITTISTMGDFSVGTTPTIPTLNSSNQLQVGLFVNRQGRVAVGNNTNPAFAFDGFGSLRMSSGTSFESQIISRNDSNDVNSGYFILEKSRNGLSVQNGDALGTLLWRGIDSANNLQNSFASIYAVAEGTIGAAPIPAGLYFNASSKFVFNGSAGEIARISSTGNLGIGTTNPQYKLHVVQDGDTLALESQVNTGRATLRLLTNGNDWEVGARGSASSPANSFYIYDNAASLYRFVINSTGNVGIGTTNPNRQLHISTASETNIILENTAADFNQKKSRIYQTSGTNPAFILSFLDDAVTTENVFFYAQRSTGYGISQLQLNPSGGNVGIGTTNALVKLDIGGETSQFPYSIRIRNTAHATSKRAAIAFGNGASHQILIDTNGNGNEDFSIYQANINRSVFFVHHQTGYVGIGGLTTPSSPLAVNGYITENPGDGTFYNVVTQKDVGFNPNQIPLNQYLGQLAFMDDYSPTQIYNPSTSTAQLTIAQSQTSGYGFIQLGRSATATNNFHFGSEGNGYFNFWNGNWGFGAGPRFTIASDGKIGIGSAGPVATLDVRTNAPQWSAFNYGANIIVGGSRNNAIGILDSTNSNPWAVVNAAGNLNFARMPALGDTTNAPNILHTFANTGNVGINTTSPGQRFTNYTNADGGIHTLTQNASTGVSAYSAFHLNTGDANAYFFLNSQNRSADGGTRTATVRNDSGDLRLQGANVNGIIVKANTGNVGIDIVSPAYKLQVNGSFAATTKSFVIDHPTKPGFKLRYGSLEGPENGVYIRGRLSESNTIELPEYWTELVDEDSITVNLTPIGRNPGIHSVIDISDNSIVIESSNDVINCFFTVFAERKDVDKLVTEYES